jgi:biopolymer transport protein ExbB/TolQ
MMKKHESVLVDVSDNLVKGFADAPDKDSSQSVHEKIESILDFISNKISTNPELKTDFRKNAESVAQRPFHSRHYKIEIYASIMSTLVQVFPLLGILGTILAIAQTAFANGGQVDVASLSNAFVLAMDTTILGITFSILFMVIESTFQPKIERVINESAEYKRIISSINLS